MAKNTEILINVCNIFLSRHSVQVGYPSITMKRIGKNKIIFVDGVRVFKQELGSMIYGDVRPVFNTKNTWVGVWSDLANQLLFMVENENDLK